MKVIATQQGQYDQVLREIGEVFELLPGEKSDIIPKINLVPKRDKQGRIIEDEYDEEPVLNADGSPVHRDYAEDVGSKLITRGPKKGETARVGWMKKVPDDTPCGFYGEQGLKLDFTGKSQLPQVNRREYGQGDKRAAAIQLTSAA